MVGKLQYSSTGNYDTYADVGSIRLMRGKDYKVEAITGKNREDDVEILGYKIKLKTTVQNLPTGFLTNDKYYFRIFFKEESQVIGTGENNYYCIQDHIGDPENYPTTGMFWEDFWALGGSRGLPWQYEASYVAADEIVLGQRKYTHGYNALLQIHNIVHHTIGIEFTCNPSDVEDYLWLT